MNKKETELLFKKFILENHNAVWGNDVLSAKKAEERYKSYGVTPPHKIYYEYKIPDSLSNYALLMNYDYMYNFQDFKIGNLISQKEHINDLRPEHRKALEQYTTKQLQDIENYIIEHKAQWAEKLQYYSDEVRRLNPELAHINITQEKFDDISKNNKWLTPTKYKAIAELNFIHGVVFGFSPDDIYYYMNRTEAQRIQDQDDERLNFIRIGHIVAPQHRDDFVRTEQQIQQIENARKNNGQEL